jgi:CBS-domain-containing membrane protein
MTERAGERRSPDSAGGARVTRGLLDRLRFTRMAGDPPARGVVALFSFVNGCLAIAIMSILAALTERPFIFPSLGPTAFLFFFTPLAPAASPRNTIYGHAIGATAGWLSLALFGLLDEGPAIGGGVTLPRVGAAALSLGLTSGLMVLARSPHPPAGATTLIVSLGILRELDALAVLMAAVLLLTVQAFAINRLAGLPYPLWAAPGQADATPPRKQGG